MFESTTELAENKLLLLYMLDKLNMPVSNLKLTEIVLENNLMNYFTLQQYVLELVSSNFLNYMENEEKQMIYITEDGKKVLSMFITRIDDKKKKSVDDFLKDKLESIKKEISISSDYTIQNNIFLVSLKAFSGTKTILEIKLSVDSNEKAKALCAKWKNSSSELCQKINDLLLKD